MSEKKQFVHYVRYIQHAQPPFASFPPKNKRKHGACPSSKQLVPQG